MNSKKQILFTITGILGICVLFSVAMLGPKYFNLYRDNRILNKTEYINVNTDMYEVSYTSFTDKLNAIARCMEEGKEIRAVKINDTGFNIDNQTINKIVKKEFKSLYKSGGLLKKIKLHAKEISSCETYTLYTVDPKDGIKGIVYRKVVYKTKKGDIVVCFDEEYHKIYGIIVPVSLYYPENIYEMSDNTKEVSSIPATHSVSGTDINYSRFRYKIMGGIFLYYNLFENSSIDVFNNDFYGYDYQPNLLCAGLVSFRDGRVLEIRGELISLSDTPSIKLGINLGELF